jgi:hypothetical protein
MIGEAAVRLGEQAASLQYYSLLDAYRRQRVKHEGAVSTAFENLLTTLAKQRGWVFIPLLAVTGKRLVPDGTIRDGSGIPRANWEAKDTDDDLDQEIEKKKAKGYSSTTSTLRPPKRRSYTRVRPRCCVLI